MIWNAMITRYAQQEGMGPEVLKSNIAMCNEGLVVPNAVSFLLSPFLSSSSLLCKLAMAGRASAAPQAQSATSLSRTHTREKKSYRSLASTS